MISQTAYNMRSLSSLNILFSVLSYRSPCIILPLIQFDLIKSSNLEADTSNTEKDILAVENNQQISSEIMTTDSSAEFLIDTLCTNPHNSEHYREEAVKGIRTNYFYIIDLEKTKLSDVCADDNGAYIKCRKTIRTSIIIM